MTCESLSAWYDLLEREREREREREIIIINFFVATKKKKKIHLGRVSKLVSFMKSS